MRAIATMVTFVAVLSPVWADNQPAGARPAKHLLIFKNVGEFPEYLFYVCPDELQPGKSAIRVPESGQVAISELDPAATNQEIFLFAVPKKLLAKADDPPNVEWFGGEFAGVLKSKLLVDPDRRVDQIDGSKMLVTEYLLTINDGLSVSSSKVLTDFHASSGHGEFHYEQNPAEQAELLLWMASGAILGVGVVFGCYLVLQRLSRRR
jgi:hypothetical protein